MSDSIPPNMGTILYIVKDIKRNQEDVHMTLKAMSENIGGINASIAKIEEENTSQNKRIYELEKAHNACEARFAIKALNKRVANLEGDYKTDLKERADASTRIDVSAQRAEALAMAPGSGMAASSGLAIFSKEIFLKVLPWFIVAALSGAAVAGFSLANYQANMSSAHYKSDAKSKK